MSDGVLDPAHRGPFGRSTRRAIDTYAENRPAAADVVAAQATVAADKMLQPIPVTKHIDRVGGLLNDGITSHSSESGFRFGSQLSTWSKDIWSVHQSPSCNLRPAIMPQSAACSFWNSATTVSFR